MRTRNHTVRQQQKIPPVVVEPFDLEEPFVNHEITMADNRTMAQMLQAPIEGYEDYAKANDANMNNLQMKLYNFQRNQNDFQRVYNDSQKKQDDFQKMMLSYMQSYHTNQSSSSSSLPSNTKSKPRTQPKANHHMNGASYDRPPIPPPVVEKEPKWILSPSKSRKFTYQVNQKELKVCKSAESLIDEPPEVELKDLPPHLEYAFLADNNKLPVIIAKDLSDDEKTALIKRRVNLKIHDVIKKEVEKLLNAGLIYPISDSPWVSPVHCVIKKGGMTVVTNDDNELVPTRLVTGWRVCIDYRKLNEATRKDHFPLPFMDQMLERLAGNEYYCFLDGFSGYF
ncbi:hypothetical protein Tco_0493922 [Tanacetum coccineum]